MAPKRSRSAPAAKQQPAARRARRGSQGAASSEQVPENGTPVVQPAGRTEDPEGVCAELVKLLGGSAAAVRKGVRKTGEVPPRYAIPDAIKITKGGPGNASRELGLLRANHSEVFEQELARVAARYGDKKSIGLFVCFPDSLGRASAKSTPVATLEGILDILVLLGGRKSANLRTKIVKVFVRYVGGDFSCY